MSMNNKYTAETEVTQSPQKGLALDTKLNKLAHALRRFLNPRWLRHFVSELKTALRYIIRGKTNMNTIEERVRKIVVEQLGVKEDEASPEASFVDDLGADSLDTVELVMALEEEFDMEIPDEEAEKIRTIQQAIDYIKKHKSE